MCVAKSPEATVSFVISSFLLSVHVEQIGSHLTDSHEVWYLCIFQYSVKKIQIKLKSDKNNWYFHENFLDLWNYFTEFLLEWETFQLKVIENLKHIFYV